MPTDPNSLPIWLGIPVAIFLLIVPGFITHNLVLTFGSVANKSTGVRVGAALNLAERVFWTLALSVATTGWIAFVLAEIGWYSIELVLILQVLYALIGGWWLARSKTLSLRLPQLKVTRRNLDGAAIAAVLLLAVGLFCWRTHESLVGAQDSGTYYDTGINIAQTGSIMVNDPLLTTFDTQGNGPFDDYTEGKLQSQLLQGLPGEANRYLFIEFQRLPAFFAIDNATGLHTGQEVPQFLHFYPVLIALAYSLFGVFGGFYLTPLLGVLGVFAVYVTARRVFPEPRQSWIAVLGALFLTLNPVQVWFVRETLTETSLQFLTFTAIYAITLFAKPYPLSAGENELLQQRDAGAARLGAFGAGLAFGLMCLTHAQFIFLIAPLFPLFVYLRLTRRWSREVWWLALPFGFFLLQAAIYIRAFALGYFEGVYHHILIFFGDEILLWFPPLVVGIIALIVLDAMPNRILAIERWIVARWKWVSLGVMLVIVGYLAYSYFIRPFTIQLDWHESRPDWYFSWQSYIGAPTTAGKERNLLRLGWYLSPLGILLTMIGFVPFCRKRLNLRSGMFLALTVIISLIFLDQSYTLEHFIYSMRRYVPVTIPAFSLIMAYALLEVLPQFGNWFAVRLNSFNTKRRTATAITGGSTASLAMSGVAFSVTTETSGPQLRLENSDITGSERKVNRGGNIGRYAGWLGAAVLVTFFVFTGATIYNLQEEQGVVSQMEGLAKNFGPNDIVIFSGDPAVDGKVAVPLNYVFDRNSFILTPAPKNDLLAQVFSYWQKQGYHIKAVLGDNGGRFAPTGYQLQQISNFTLTLTQLEQLDVQKPKNVVSNSISYGVYNVLPETSSNNGSVAYGQGAPTQPNGWTLQMGQDAYPALIDGLYPAEKDKPSDPTNLTYRWTDGDTNHHPTLRLPCFAPNTKTQLSLTLSPGLNPHPVTLKLFLSDYMYDDPNDPKTRLTQPAGSIQIAPGSGIKTYTIDVPSNLPFTSCDNGSLILHIGTNAKEAFVPQQLNLGINDTRLLGVKFYSLNITQKP